MQRPEVAERSWGSRGRARKRHARPAQSEGPSAGPRSRPALPPARPLPGLCRTFNNSKLPAKPLSRVSLCCLESQSGRKAILVPPAVET